MYKRMVSIEDSLFTVNHEYKLNKSWISAKETADFLVKQNDISDKFTYYVSTLNRIVPFKLSYISIIFLLCPMILFTLFLVVKRVVKRSVVEEAKKEAKQFGGWLLLPILLLPLSLYLQGTMILSDDYLNVQVWKELYELGFEDGMRLIFINAFETMGNVFLMMFTLYIIYKFFRKSAMLPSLLITMLIANIVWLVVDTTVVGYFASDALGKTEYLAAFKEIFMAMVIAAIWVPYFKLSKRVQETFVR